VDRIIVNNISKKFKKDLSPKTILYKILSLISKRDSKEEFNVLEDISLNVKKGEIVGIIGENGSGKSTLLRIIAGIYKSDKGEIKTDGKIISLIGLDSALEINSTMEYNIYLLGTFFGLDKKEIKEKFKEIVRFSGLEQFVNTRVYKFSAGMKSRLIFSIAINCNPEILLLDEILEVGDEEFKGRSEKKIKEFVQKGGSVLIVSHYLEAIQKSCNRIIWLEKGKVKIEGDPAQVVEDYVTYSWKKAQENSKDNTK
jgi:ABC-type polysaccharide/polyol phosphate transport system ATPase subunit